MAGHEIEKTRARKGYYRQRLRLMVKMLYLSTILSACFIGGIFYKTVTRPIPMFYATNSAGAGFITPLKRLPGPNMLPKALLKADPPEEVTIKQLTL